VSDRVIRRYKDGVVDALYFVTTPSFVEPGFYRQVLSSEAFRFHWMKKRQKKVIVDGGVEAYVSKHVPGVSFSVQDRDDWDMLQDSWKRMGKKDPLLKLPQYQYTSQWDFYEAIGWDHRKKRFKEVPNVKPVSRSKAKTKTK